MEINVSFDDYFDIAMTFVLL